MSQFVELRIGAFMNYIKLKLHPPFIALSTASGGTEGEGQLGGFAPKPLFALSLFGSAFARLGAWGRRGIEMPVRHRPKLFHTRGPCVLARKG